MILDFKMAWRNVWRNPRRTLLTVLAIGFAAVLLVFMLSFQLGTYETMINASLRIQTGHMQVQADGYHDNRRMREVVADPAVVAGILDATPGIRAHTARSEAFSMVSSNDRTYGTLIVGIDPEREAGISSLKQIVREGRYLSGADTDGTLIGSLLAKNLGVSVGDELTVLGQGRDGSVAAALVSVVGIYTSGVDEFDRSVVHIPIGTFDEI